MANSAADAQVKIVRIKRSKLFLFGAECAEEGEFNLAQMRCSDPKLLIGRERRQCVDDPS